MLYTGVYGNVIFRCVRKTFSQLLYSSSRLQYIYSFVQSENSSLRLAQLSCVCLREWRRYQSLAWEQWRGSGERWSDNVILCLLHGGLYFFMDTDSPRLAGSFMLVFSSGVYVSHVILSTQIKSHAAVIKILLGLVTVDYFWLFLTISVPFM